MSPGYYSHFFQKETPEKHTEIEKKSVRPFLSLSPSSHRRGKNEYTGVYNGYMRSFFPQDELWINFPLYYSSIINSFAFNQNPPCTLGLVHQHISFFRPSIFACSPIFWFDTLSCVQQARGSLPPSCRMIIIMYLEWGNLFKNIQRLRTKTL